MTFIGVSAGRGDRARLTLKSAELSPRILRVDDRGARIALVSTTALLLAGDQVEINIEVGVRCWLEVVDTAGTVAYDARGGKSSWSVRIQVADGGRLLWKAEPFVIANGADVTRTSMIELATDGVACLRETLVLGRSGECGGALRARTRATHEGRLLLAEDLDLADREVRERPGILGAHRVIDSVVLLGRRAPAEPGQPATRRFELAGPGTVARYLGTDLHQSGVPATFAGWRRQLADEAVPS